MLTAGGAGSPSRLKLDPQSVLMGAMRLEPAVAATGKASPVTQAATDRAGLSALTVSAPAVRLKSPPDLPATVRWTAGVAGPVPARVQGQQSPQMAQSPAPSQPPQVSPRPQFPQPGQLQSTTPAVAVQEPAVVPTPPAGDPLLSAVFTPAPKVPALPSAPIQASGAAADVVAAAVVSPAQAWLAPHDINPLASAIPRPAMPAESLQPGDRLSDRAALEADLADRTAASASLSAALAQPAVALAPSAPTPGTTMARPEATAGAALAAGAAVDPGRLQVDLQSPDLGQMRLDLAIDPGGNARLVVHAASESAALSLGERTGQLVDAMREMGLSLQVDVRQGGGQGAGANPQPSGSPPGHAASARDASLPLSTPAAAAPARRSPAHPQALSFYA